MNPGDWVRTEGDDGYWEVVATKPQAQVVRLRWLGSTYTVSVHESAIAEQLAREPSSGPERPASFLAGLALVSAAAETTQGGPR